jgi:hypothetical protein
VSAQVRERVSRVEVARRRTLKVPLGLNAGEVIAIVVAFVLGIWVVAYYFASLRPLQDQLRTLQTELDRQEKNLVLNSKPTGAAQKTPEELVKDTIESLDHFRGNYLKPYSSGRIDLIKEINALAKKNNVTLTSGIEMDSPSLESGEKKNEKSRTSQKNKSDEIFNAFPSVNFHFTVFGQYSNIRAFINELEQEKQFLVVHSVSLVNQEARAHSGSRRTRSEGLSGIMLTIEMQAYFHS